MFGSRRRCNPGGGGLLAMGSVAVLVALLVGWWVLSSRPHPIPMAATVQAPAMLSPDGSPPSLAARPSSPANGGLVVDVAGKVRHPGLYRLASGARVQDALIAAGGMVPGVDPVTVNLARKLTDGEQLVIGLPAAAEPVISGAGNGVGGPGNAAATGLVDLNTATAEQLDALPGVGPVLAQRILDWRSQHGRFDSVDALSQVTGIGAAKLADLKPLVTVS